MNKKANLSLVILSVVALFALGGIAIMYNGGATGAAATAGSADVQISVISEDPRLIVHGNANMFSIRASTLGDVLTATAVIGDNNIKFSTSVSDKMFSDTRMIGVIDDAPTSVPILMFVAVERNGIRLTSLDGVTIRSASTDAEPDHKGFNTLDVTAIYGFEPTTQEWLGFFPNGVTVPNQKIIIIPEGLPILPVDNYELFVRATIPTDMLYTPFGWNPNPVNAQPGDWIVMSNGDTRQITVNCVGPGTIPPFIALNSGERSFFQLNTPGVYQCTETTSLFVGIINVI